MIEIEHISKSFGPKEVLKDINFTLDNCEIVALLGENGAGKSTLMRIICGYISPSLGNIKISNHDVINNRIEALSNVGYVPEISALYGDMSVFDFLMWFARIWQINNPEDCILKVAQQMNIIDVLGERIENLSKGFKKRVEIASAILHEPSFLILDEPTDGLDPNQKFEIREFIKQYAQKKTVLVSTHVLEDIDIAHRIIMLSQGKVISDTSLDNFKKVSKQQDLRDAFRILSTKEGA